MIQTVAMRVHNYVAKRISRLNPGWNDDFVFEESRRVTVAIFQHITYTEYLPIVLGWRFMLDYGLLPPTKGYSYDYSDKVVPWTYGEWTAAAFRLHSSVYGKIALVNASYYPEKVVRLEEHFNSAILYRNPANFDKIVRGYIWARQRRIDEYYDESVSTIRYFCILLNMELTMIFGLIFHRLETCC